LLSACTRAQERLTVLVESVEMVNDLGDLIVSGAGPKPMLRADQQMLAEMEKI